MLALVLSRTAMMKGKPNLVDIGGVELGEQFALGVGQRVEPGGGLFPGRFRRQPLGLRQLAGEVGVGVEHAEPLGLAGRAEDAAQRIVQAAGAVMRGAEFQLEGAFGDPGRMLEDAAEALRRSRRVSMRDGRSAGGW